MRGAGSGETDASILIVQLRWIAPSANHRKAMASSGAIVFKIISINENTTYIRPLRYKQNLIVPNYREYIKLASLFICWLFTGTKIGTINSYFTRQKKEPCLLPIAIKTHDSVLTFFINSGCHFTSVAIVVRYSND